MIDKCKILAFFLTIIVFFASCSEVEDSRVPVGYPYGDYSELNFTIFENCNKHKDNQQSGLFSKVFDGSNTNLVTDRKTCDSLFKIISPGCDCSGIDFDKKALACLNGYVYKVTEAEFTPRVIINHKRKELTIELRAYSKTYKNYDVYTFTNYNKYFTELLVIPKPPSNYNINTNYYLPAAELP